MKPGVLKTKLTPKALYDIRIMAERISGIAFYYGDDPEQDIINIAVVLHQINALITTRRKKCTK
jgi:hypothetical protein